MSCKVKQNKIKNIDILSFFKRPVASISIEISNAQTRTKLLPNNYIVTLFFKTISLNLTDSNKIVYSKTN